MTDANGKELTMEDLFDMIHKGQAENMLKILQSGVVSSAEMSAINKFLSDNNITGVRGSNKTLNKLEAGLAAYDSEETEGFHKSH